MAHCPVPETVAVAQWYADRLTERGRKNVRVAYHSGAPYSDDVIREMNAEGINKRGPWWRRGKSRDQLL